MPQRPIRTARRLTVRTSNERSWGVPRMAVPLHRGMTCKGLAHTLELKALVAPESVKTRIDDAHNLVRKTRQMYGPAPADELLPFEGASHKPRS